MYTRLSSTLRALRRYKEAQQQINVAVKMFPEELTVWVENAHIAAGTQEWEEAMRRWELIEQRFPTVIISFQGKFVALMVLGMFAEARELVRVQSFAFRKVQSHIAIWHV